MILLKIEIWVSQGVDGIALHFRGLEPAVHGAKVGDSYEYVLHENESLAAIHGTGIHLNLL